MTITPEDLQKIQEHLHSESLQKIQEHLEKMQQPMKAAIAALENDPTSPENLAKLQMAMSAYSSSLGLAASTITKIEEANRAILGKF